MVARSLLDEDVQRGRETLSALDSAGFDVRAALWVFNDDGQDWRFTIAEPSVDIRGPRPLYERMAQALTAKSNLLPLREIYAVSPDDGLVSLVRVAVSTPANANAGIYFRGNVVMGTTVPDMYIYRMCKPPIGMVGQ